MRHRPAESFGTVDLLGERGGRHPLRLAHQAHPGHDHARPVRRAAGRSDLPAADLRQDILHVGASGLGFLQSADAVGAVCMAVLLAHLPPLRRAGVTLLWAVAGFGVATIVFGLSQWFWLSLAMMFLVGALDNISVVVRHTLVQMLTPDEMRGRVSAVNSVFIVASNDLGGLESGLTAWLFGPVISVVGGGVGTILVVLAAMRLWPQILSIGSLGRHPARRRGRTVPRA